MYKAIIFDLDGVLVHTDKYHYLAWKKIADLLNIPFDEQSNNKLRGVSRSESLDILLGEKKADFDDRQKANLMERKNKDYQAMISLMSPRDLSFEIVPTLQALKKRGYLLAIGSSSKNARLILERIGIIDLFDAISDGNNIVKSKPDPEVFLKAAEMLSVAPNQCVVVEDASAGIDAANSGGFFSVGIGDATKYKKTKRPINTLSDLLTLFADKRI